ncbi:hypothetical protein E7T06_08530 [Deinococcus sp. Arct2-2]|uniref:hypothetical protein n=1 Tax=Deinococcus sp. Arct2-2 TaxID=2568653 RepID=UPI0010A3D23A|nr:hypothetical protein [Deinococcus sp. Arct2-2]THF70221.1 hypothetical protein E7T06_08530 [Deinococcus sp. Arct2-2]
MTTLFSPSPADQVAAQTQLDQLEAQAGQVPTPLTDVLESFLGQLISGKAVQVVTLGPETGTQQEAELLQVVRIPIKSRAFWLFIRLKGKGNSTD